MRGNLCKAQQTPLFSTDNPVAGKEVPAARDCIRCSSSAQNKSTFHYLRKMFNLAIIRTRTHTQPTPATSALCRKVKVSIQSESPRTSTNCVVMCLIYVGIKMHDKMQT